MEELRKRQFRFSTLYVLIAVLVMWGLQQFVFSSGQPERVPYSQLLAEIEQRRVKEVRIEADEIFAVLKTDDEVGAAAASASASASAPAPASSATSPPAKPERGKTIVATRLPQIDETALIEKMVAHDVVFSGASQKSPWWSTLLLGWVLPFVVLFGLWTFAVKRLGKGAGPLSFGQAKAKIHDLNQKERVTFEDVAGIDEAKGELVEIVSFLKDPSRYQKVGARSPKGVLLVGPPGTGKTLLARAVAGEASVPFFSMSGSEFIQMFVGVGAARVRDLFEQAKERAPCIVFIDELDAIGRSRSGAAGGFAVHEEREQTLNQLLVEMDGFDASKGVVILAATNRPEVLDAALLRAGRFDRQVVVDRPDVRGREAILRVHARKVNVEASFDFHVIAQRTPGMTGADLANVVNEAALAVARRDGNALELRDFEEAVDRIQLGLKKQGRVMMPEERRRVAFHESGHALVALSLKHADPVHRVTIIPRSIGALGVTLQLPTEDRYLVTREELTDRICVLLGGRAAEQLLCDGVSTGAQNDLERATELARQMVCRFGMSDAIGPVTYGAPAGARFLEMPVSMGEQRNFSEATAQKIDQEVVSLLTAEADRAKALLAERKEVLETLATRLLQDETLDRPTLESIAGRVMPPDGVSA